MGAIVVAMFMIAFAVESMRTVVGAGLVAPGA